MLQNIHSVGTYSSKDPVIHYHSIIVMYVYCMVGNFRGVQIFMDFMHSVYPRKISVF